ncbi:MAG: hypothetical protein CM15mV133_120 [uncultured marine virus]|nr:MAG: hypothetical protein CM15mV133_120 [uncultured marine virus]
MRRCYKQRSAADDKYLFPNSDTSEGGGIPMNFTATGFDLANEDTSNKSGDTFDYMAIRRGGMQTPSARLMCFMFNHNPDGASYSVGFPTDLILLNKTGGSSANTYVGSRLLEIVHILKL